jgi:outer membrane protein OmpA-like peptidoglycan-associated protein
VNLAVDAGTVTLTGAVPSESARAALVDPARATFGANAVDDQLTVDPDIGDDGLTGLDAVLSALGREAKSATVRLDDGRITLTGTAPTTAAKQAAVEAAGRAAGSPGAVTDELTVAATPAAEVQRALAALPPIGFLTGSATLSAAGRRAVAQAAAVLKANPAVRVRIEGHTDSVGAAAKNLALSRSRAAAVRAALRSLGVADGRMTSTGYGETRPKVRGDSPSARAVNRRVEFVVQR